MFFFTLRYRMEKIKKNPGAADVVMMKETKICEDVIS
jgi:hypothetical protein